MDDNIFDDDDALDYILYEDCENNVKQNGRGGCLSVYIVFLVPLGSLPFLFWYL